jgi:hypothetical protein
MPPSKLPVPFIAAGVVLLVMPLLVAFGIGVLGLSMGLPDTDPRVSSRVLLIGFSVWIILVAIAVAVFMSRLLRRSQKS